MVSVALPVLALSAMMAAQATDARATVGEGRRGDGRQDCAILEGLQVQEVDGGSSVRPLSALTISGWPEFAQPHLDLA